MHTFNLVDRVATVRGTSVFASFLSHCIFAARIPSTCGRSPLRRRLAGAVGALPPGAFAACWRRVLIMPHRLRAAAEMTEQQP